MDQCRSSKILILTWHKLCNLASLIPLVQVETTKSVQSFKVVESGSFEAWGVDKAAEKPAPIFRRKHQD